MSKSVVRTFEVAILALPGESITETYHRILDAMLLGAPAGARNGSFDFSISEMPIREINGFETVTSYSLTSDVGVHSTEPHIVEG